MKTLFTIVMGLAVLAGCGKPNDDHSQDEGEAIEKHIPSEAEIRQTPDPARGASGNIEDVLGRLLAKFPPGQNIPPDDFHKDPDAEKLLGLAAGDIEPLLAAADYAKPLMVINPLTFEQWKTRVIPTLGRGPVPVRNKEGYAKYLADCRRHGEARCLIQHKRQMVVMLMRKKVSEYPKCLEELLRHKSVFVQDFAIRWLVRGAPKREDIVDVLLEKLPQKFTWDNKGYGHEESLKLELPYMIIRLLSDWRSPKVLPFVRKLGEHPYYRYRRDGIGYIRRYGVQESVPYLIKLLNDEHGFVRENAFYNLATLTCMSMGWNREFWSDDDLMSDQKAAGVAAWTKWWERHGKDVADVDFHRGAVERAIVLMERHGPENSKIECSTTPMHLLGEHLGTEISIRGNRDRFVSEFKVFWKQNRARMSFDDFQQKLVLSKN
jgi:hypothetical protein